MSNQVEQQRQLVEQLKREAQVTRISVSQVLNTFFSPPTPIDYVLHSPVDIYNTHIIYERVTTPK